jgi:hypothetical protein
MIGAIRWRILATPMNDTRGENPGLPGKFTANELLDKIVVATRFRPGHSIDFIQMGHSDLQWRLNSPCPGWPMENKLSGQGAAMR